MRGQLSCLGLPLIVVLVGLGVVVFQRQPISGSVDSRASPSPQGGGEVQKKPLESSSDSGREGSSAGAIVAPRAWARLVPALPVQIESGVQGAIPARIGQEARISALSRILENSGLFDSVPVEHREGLAMYAGSLAFSEGTPLYCWSEQTEPGIVRAYQTVEREILGGAVQTNALQVTGRWPRTAVDGNIPSTQGLPVTLTWSIAPDGTPIDADAMAPSNLRSRLAAIYGGSTTADPRTQVWFPIFQQVFDNLASRCGVRFLYEPNDDGATVMSLNFETNWGVSGARGDIRICGHRVDGNSGRLAYAFPPDVGDVVVDTDDSYILTTTSDSIRLRNILEHEVGHCLGLAHVCPANGTKLMEPQINTGFRGVQFDDIYSHQRNYGDTFERRGANLDNDTKATAYPLALESGVKVTWDWLSIDGSGDVDWFSLPLVTGKALKARIVPSDPIAPQDPNVNTYLEGAQNANGSCTAGTAFDPTSQQDLALEVLAPDGLTVLAASNVTGAGKAEEIAGLALPSQGVCYVRVRATGANRAQLYRMELELTASTQEATVTLQNLMAVYDGNPKSAGVATVPPDLPVQVTYDGSLTVPVVPGIYHVHATVAAAGFAGAAAGDLTIQSAYAVWMADHAAPGNPQSGPDQDLDGDGWDNLAEYSFGTLPNKASSIPRLQYNLMPSVLRIEIPAGLPPGISVAAETSSSLTGGWTSAGVVEAGGGFEVPRSAGNRYLRMIYELREEP